MEEDSAPPRPFSAVATVAHAAAVRSMKSSNLCIHGGRGRDKAGGGGAVPAIIAALWWAATSRGGDIRSAWRRRYGIRRRDIESEWRVGLANLLPFPPDRCNAYFRPFLPRPSFDGCNVRVFLCCCAEGSAEGGEKEPCVTGAAYGG